MICCKHKKTDLLIEAVPFSQVRKRDIQKGHQSIDGLVIFVYLSSLPIAHLSDASRRRLVVTGDSARVQDETAENSV